ncbi:hypothetical protein Tco_1581975 [Tanacetum coccineum]
MVHGGANDSIFFDLGLEFDIGNIIFSDLVTKLQDGKKGREPNVFYTRFLSLLIEKLLGENYNNDDITLLKPYTISTASFKKPLAYKVALTSHMLKVAKILNESKQSLILPSEEVNADDATDKSLSGTNVQLVTQPKAKTDKKSRKKKIPSSTQPKTSQVIRESSPPTQVADTQHAKEPVATADTT